MLQEKETEKGSSLVLEWLALGVTVLFLLSGIWYVYLEPLFASLGRG